MSNYESKNPFAKCGLCTVLLKFNMKGLRSEDYSASDAIPNNVSIQSIERRILEQRIESAEPFEIVDDVGLCNDSSEEYEE